ncbi:MAG: glycosyltransferase family 4 protein [Alphaproteobacteria bacterium]|nr:glycosyltransferase family 4 protein [Alphaproteobacteria bacterium]
MILKAKAKKLILKVVAAAAALDKRPCGPFGRREGVCYVVPNANWAADTVGSYVTRGIRETGRMEAATVTREDLPRLRGQILHFGTIGDFAASCNSAAIEKNKIVVTVFHGDRDSADAGLSRSIDRFLAGLATIDMVVTGCGIMERRLAEWGVPGDKLVRVPLGVDLKLFCPPPSPLYRNSLRSELGIPEDRICIGSFQKDGNGWQEGLEPKLIKGPDVFLDTLNLIKDKYPVFVLLTGPARGFVRQGLEKMGIPYAHAMLSDYSEVVRYYHALDMYLMTSREDGAPAALLESFACGVPLIATRVGMVPDITVDGDNALTAESENSHALASRISTLLETPGLAEKLARNGAMTISRFGWAEIAGLYLERVYLPLSGA